jgi:hypothetical protein
MAKRRLLNGEGSKKPGTFQPGNKVAVGNRSLPAARRLTNRFFAETLFHELTALHPKTQQQRWTRIIRRAIVDAEGNGELARKFVVDVMNRFLGQATLPIAWADLTPRDGNAPRSVRMITPDMSDAEAGRVYQEMLRGGQDERDNDKGDRERAMDIARRQNAGPDDEPEEERPHKEMTDAEAARMVQGMLRRSGAKRRPSIQEEIEKDMDAEAEERRTANPKPAPAPVAVEPDPDPDDDEDEPRPRIRPKRSRYAGALARAKSRF